MTDPLFKPLAEADIYWKQDTPISSTYDDVYFSSDNGFEEVNHVFIQGNQLAQRWQNHQGDFTIAETGFGAGLNFFIALDLWLASTNEGTLHFISAEQAPLSKATIERAIKQWPSLNTLLTAILKQLPERLPGIHRINLPEKRVSLTLLYGDATECYQNLSNEITTVDAWFLDGFTPAKNPQIWTQALFNTIARLSRESCSLSTFSAATAIKKGLESVGFTMTKKTGYGKKREMLVGSLDKPRLNTNKPSTPWYLASKQQEKSKTAIVIGAGIAGCTTALALANRGIQSILVDKHPQAAMEGSGNPQAILYPKLSLRQGLLSRFGLAALAYSTRYYQNFWQADDNPDLGGQCGVLLLTENEKQQASFLEMAKVYPTSFVQLVNRDHQRQLTGLALTQPGLYFPNLGWINPQAVCAQLINHPLIDYQQKSIQQIHWDGNCWHVDGFKSNTMVIATANETTQFDQTKHLPLKPVAGQISVAPLNTNSSKLKTVICGHAYIAPAHNKLHTFGASYHLDTQIIDVTTRDHQQNLDQLSETDAQIGELFKGLDISSLTGRTATRCTTPDYLPIAGRAPIYDDFLKIYNGLRNDAKLNIEIKGSYHPNLYVNCGHGSRGMSYAPLCAEVIASLINHEIPPLEKDLLMALNPARFVIRDLKRNRV